MNETSSWINKVERISTELNINYLNEHSQKVEKNKRLRGRNWSIQTGPRNAITDAKVLDMPLLDTTQHKDSLGTFVADLVLQILSWIAEEERERIRKRQRAGIDVAMQNVTVFSRPKITTTGSLNKHIIDGNQKRLLL